MATPLDLEEQEQLDALKHFWKTYGNLISGLLIVVMGGFAAWNGYGYWQRSQAASASALFDELERAVAVGEVPRVERALADMKDKFGGTVYAQQAALLAAKTFQQQDKPDQALAALSWVADHASDESYAQIARLRASSYLLQSRAYEAALTRLAKPFSASFAPLAADLRGDVLSAQAKPQEAIAAYREAWQKMEVDQDYRRLIEAKLNALGVDPKAPEATAGGSK